MFAPDSCPPAASRPENADFSPTDSAGVVARVGSCVETAELDATCGRKLVLSRVRKATTAAVGASGLPAACAGGATTGPSVESIALVVVIARTDLRKDATGILG